MDIVDANSKQTADSRQARTCILFYLICLWTMCAQCKSVRSEEGPGLGSRNQDRDPGPGRQLAAWAHRAPWDPKGFLGHEEGPRVILGLQGDPASAISHVCVRKCTACETFSHDGGHCKTGRPASQLASSRPFSTATSLKQAVQHCGLRKMSFSL